LVDFVARTIDRQTEPYALYNAGLGEAAQIRRLVEMIVAASGRALAIEHDLSRPTIPTSVLLDSAKAERELDWVPRVTLKEGIARTVAWWRDNVGALPGLSTGA